MLICFVTWYSQQKKKKVFCFSPIKKLIGVPVNRLIQWAALSGFDHSVAEASPPLLDAAEETLAAALGGK